MIHSVHSISIVAKSIVALSAVKVTITIAVVGPTQQVVGQVVKPETGNHSVDDINNATF